MVNLLTNVGLTIENAVGRVFEAEKGLAVIDQLSGLTALLGVTNSQFREQCLPLQYVLVGRKA
jgi:hypothetical protein